MLLRKLANKIPVLPSLYVMLRNRYDRLQLKAESAEQLFTSIYRDNVWRGRDSRSGSGSDMNQTRVVIKELQAVFSEFGISTLLDIPCGDFHWMKNVDLSNIDYTGADIVDELIENNKQQHVRDGVRFQKLDLTKDELPEVDLVFCRDCLVHLSFQDVLFALDNICKSSSKYLLTTTFTGTTKNYDIATGQWRALNLERAPFTLARPLKIINEGCTEGNGSYSDKALGLWRIADVRESLARR